LPTCIENRPLIDHTSIYNRKADQLCKHILHDLYIFI
jgi:hypothetical protein